MPLVPAVTELLLAEFMHLQYQDKEKPIDMYINSTGVQVRTWLQQWLTPLASAHRLFSPMSVQAGYTDT